MIKFFRNIRKNLLNEGETTKYLKYAIGEIVLVMIGILLALQVNNWNQERNQRQKEKKILTELKRDLVSNDSILQNYMGFQQKLIEETTIAIEHIKSKKPYNDSIGLYLNSISLIERIQFVSSAYESLKSLGIDLISSDQLRADISYLFGNEIPFKTIWIRDAGLKHADLFLPLHLKFFEIQTPDNTNQNTRLVPDYDNLLKSQDYINILSRKKVLKIAVTDDLKQLQNRVKKTIQSIDKELETFNQ